MKLRKILVVVLALALLCTTLAACGNDSGSSNSSGSNSSSAETGDTATGPSGGTLNLRSTMEPTSLNSLLATYAYDFTPMQAMIECLYRDDENDIPQPAAAESVDISEDGLTYTFHLREDAVWSNGDPVVATDFEFAWKQALNPEVAASYGYILYMLENAEAYFNYESYVFKPDAWVEANPDKEIPAEVTWEDVGVKVIDEYTL